MKINLLTAILIIVTILLCSVFLIYNSNEKISRLEDELNNLKSTYSAELDEKDDESEDIQTESENTQNIIPSIFTATEKNKTQGVDYSFEETVTNLSIDIRDGVPYIIAHNTSDSSIEDLLRYTNIDKNEMQIRNTEYTEITGFTKKVINAHIATIGHDVAGTKIVFLMEDGTVEYSTLSNMLTNVSTQGKIEGLSNIVSLHNASVSYHDGGGYATIVALDAENYFYNLNNY